MFKVNREELSDHVEPCTIMIFMSEQSVFDLAVQKIVLLEKIQGATEEDAEALTGLLHLLDHVQDKLVQTKIFTEDNMFPYKTEE